MVEDDNYLFNIIKEVIRDNIDKFDGYVLDDNGNVIYDVVNQNKQSVEELEPVYQNLKDCSEYIEAVKWFDDSYEKEEYVKKLQHDLKNNIFFPYNFFLVMFDTFFVSEKIKDNPVVNSMIDDTELKPWNYYYPSGEFLKRTVFIEAGLRAYDKLDDTTKKEIFNVVYHTVRDVDILEGNYLGTIDYLYEKLKEKDRSELKRIKLANKELRRDKYII